MKKIFITVLAVITSFTAFIYFASCFTPYISPVHFWPMAFLALGFPYLALCIIFLAFCWIFIKRKIGLCLLVLLFAGFQNLFATFAFCYNSPSQQYAKDRNSIRILTWNVRNFDNPSVFADSPMAVRRQVFNYIKKCDADVLCFQEFSEHTGPNLLSNTAELVRLGYTHFYKTNDVSRTFDFGTITSGTAIFSKLPIIDSGKVMLGDSSYPEHIAYCDIIFQKKPLRIFSTHFKSMNLFTPLRDSVYRAAYHNDYQFVYKGTKFEKIKVFSQDHVREALIAKKQLNKSLSPVIFCADMNSVPTSYPYHIMSQGLQDAFVTKGCGLGTTLDGLPKTLRIDFVFADKKLDIKNLKKDELHLSDHFPQCIDLTWKL